MMHIFVHVIMCIANVISTLFKITNNLSLFVTIQCKTKQMIGHMERLILKGDVSDKPPNPLHSPKALSKIDRRRSDASTMSTTSHQRKASVSTTNSCVIPEFGSPDKKKEKDEQIVQIAEEEDVVDDDDNGTVNETNFKNTVDVAIENPFKHIIEDNIPEDDLEDEGGEGEEELQIDEDDYFAGLSRLSVCGSPSRSRSTSNENQAIFSPGSTSKILGGGGKSSHHVEKKARQPFVINPRRVTLSFTSENGMRKSKCHAVSTLNQPASS